MSTSILIGDRTYMWQGDYFSEEKISGSVIHYFFGRKFKIDNVLTANENELIDIYNNIMNEDIWMHKINDNMYELGNIVIDNKKIIFYSNEVKKYEDISIEDKFLKSLFFNIEFRYKILDLDFARSFNTYLQNRVLKNDEKYKKVLFSWRTIGSIIAKFRNVGEDYLDFYLDFSDDKIKNLDENINNIVSILKNLGWHEATDIEIQEDNKEAMRILEKVEMQPENTFQSYLKNIYSANLANIEKIQKSEKKDLFSRMYKCDLEGRVSKSDYLLFFDLLI